MDNDKGSILILSIIIGAIMFLLSNFLLYAIHLDNQIVTSSVNNTQSYYLAEDKIYLCFDEGSTYYDELISILKHYLKYKGFSNPPNKNTIIIDKEDLNLEDTKRKVKTDTFIKDNILNGCIGAESDYKSIDKKVCGIFTVINPLYNMGEPIVSKNIDGEFEKEDIEEFINQIFNGFKLESFEDDIEIIDVDSFHRVDIYINDDKTENMRIDFFKYEDEIKPIEKKYLSKDEIFLILKNKKDSKSEVNIYGNEKKVINTFKGIIYVDGNLNLYNKVQFNGIIAINSGKLNVCSKIGKPNIKGMFIVNNYMEDEKLIEEKVNLEYRQEMVDRFGIYLPEYVKPKLYIVREGGMIKK